MKLYFSLFTTIICWFAIINARAFKQAKVAVARQQNNVPANEPTIHPLLLSSHLFN